MSFSSKTKNELARLMNNNMCCKKAELASIIKLDGTIEIKGKNRLAVRITTENAQLARKIFIMIKELYKLNIEIMVRNEKKLKRNNLYTLILAESKNPGKVLIDLGILHESSHEGLHLHSGIDSSIINEKCCKKAYLRGAFLGGGSLSDPNKIYHLEFITIDKKFSQDLINLITYFNLNPKTILRKDKYTVYLKGAEQIVDFINLVGAHNTLLYMENIRIVKDVRNNVNRIVNCETANLNKTINASFKQIENIQTIDRKIGLKKLPKPIQDIAYARIENPDANLKELGEMLTPPISKSGVNHRLRKLNSIAKKL